MRQGSKLNEKLVVRFYKEELDGVEGQIQVPPPLPFSKHITAPTKSADSLPQVRPPPFPRANTHFWFLDLQ
jgi:hypothetical protein